MTLEGVWGSEGPKNKSYYDYWDASNIRQNDPSGTKIKTHVTVYDIPVARGKCCIYIAIYTLIKIGQIFVNFERDFWSEWKFGKSMIAILFMPESVKIKRVCMMWPWSHTLICVQIDSHPNSLFLPLLIYQIYWYSNPLLVDPHKFLFKIQLEYGYQWKTLHFRSDAVELNTHRELFQTQEHQFFE